MFNRVVLVGKIISDLRFSRKDDTDYVDFILESRRYFGESPNKHIDLLKIKVLTWDYNAILCKDKLKKDSYVLVEGALKYDRERDKYYIGAWNVVFLDKMVDLIMHQMVDTAEQVSASLKSSQSDNSDNKK